VPERKTVAIHQPNFFPWLGTFHKIAMVDEFIFFDHVQAPRGKSWVSRNKILLSGKAGWLTIPIRKSGKGYQRISDVCINYGTNFERKHLGTIKQAYQKSAHFKEVYAMIESIYANKYERLADFNKEYIQLVSARVGLKASFQSSTEMVNKNSRLAGLTGNEVVLKLCMQATANRYISGVGCLEFIEPLSFEEEGIEFYFQRFVHREYRQVNTASFVSHLSSLDALFNVGFDGLRSLISGKQTERAV